MSAPKVTHPGRRFDGTLYPRFMTTWAEVQAHVRNRFELETDTARSFSLWFRYEDGRKQRVVVRRFRAFEIEWLEFRSTVCSREELALDAALRRNEETACGALALDGDDTYVLIYSAPLPTMDTEELELPLYVVASHASQLKAELSRPG